ncbi:MAG: amidophosphoribosyltransferase [Pseudomonadota bacterium]
MCGIIGIHNHPESANLAYLCLYALQHRGQESAGIVSSDEGRFYQRKEMGLVADVFDERNLNELKGKSAIGHVRYSTSGESSITNVQPLFAELFGDNFSLAHNGNITNALKLREELKADGAVFQTTSDSEVIIHLLVRSPEGKFEDRLKWVLEKIEGAYSIVILKGTQMIAVRDPMGIRPLVLGQVKDSYVVASEGSCFNLIDGLFLREIAPGEMLIFEGMNYRSIEFKKPSRIRPCIFEYVYFARPDSTIFGRSVYEVRKLCGRALSQEKPVDADVIVPVPDSGLPAALGYAEASGIPFEMGLIRSHYVGRTFIEPESSIRHFGVKLKLSPLKEVITGKRVIVIDDSIVRGTTSMKIVKMIRNAGASEVHLRISSPPTRWPCLYGIDTPNRDELIASSKSVEEIRDYVTADSLEYLSIEGLKSFDSTGNYCDACFSGDYPIQPTDRKDLREKAKAHVACGQKAKSACGM